MSKEFENAGDAYEYFYSSNTSHSTEGIKSFGTKKPFSKPLPNFSESFEEGIKENGPACEMPKQNLFETYNEGSSKNSRPYSKMNEAHLESTPILTSKHLKAKKVSNGEKGEFLFETVSKVKRKVRNDSDENVQDEKFNLDENSPAMISADNSKERSSNEFCVNSNVPNTINSNFCIKKLEKKRIFTNTTELIHNDEECSTENPFSKSFSYLKSIKQFFSFSSEEKDKEDPNLKRSHISESAFIRPSNHLNIVKPRYIQTLEDSLEYFNLSTEFQELETSLESVRRNKHSNKDHEDCFKKIDKKILMLSLHYHPDKVKGKGGTESEIETAQYLQTALNALRTALIFLNSSFIEDIGIEHHFGFYTKMRISSVYNEDEMKEHMYKITFKIQNISQVKQLSIIPEIRKFLIKSKNCIRSYLEGKFDDFEIAREASLLHLKYCIKGFEKLCAEIQEVKEQCKSEKKGENMLFVLQSMASKSERNLNLLQSLEKFAKASLNGKHQFFSPEEVMDPYFVLPLVSYTNVILMCNVMVKNTSGSYKFSSRTKLPPRFKKDLSYFMFLYYLASYYSGNKNHKQTALGIMKKEHSIDKEEIKSEFNKRMENVIEIMESKFIVDHYPEKSTLDRDHEKCIMLMKEFKEEEKEALKEYKELQKKFEKMNEEQEEFLRTMKSTEELDQKMKERLEECEKFSEIVANVLSE